MHDDELVRRKKCVEEKINDDFLKDASKLIVRIRNEDHTLSLSYQKKVVMLDFEKVEDDLDGIPTGYIKREIQKLIET